MARGVNKAIIVGTLGNDPEVKQLNNGSAVANLSVATNESWKDKNTGEPVEKTEWHRIVVFGRLAEICGQYLRKGSQAYFEGKIQTRKWQDQNGQDRYSTEIVANEMQMLGGRNDGGQGASQGAGGYAQNNSGFDQGIDQSQPGQQAPQGQTRQQPQGQSPAAAPQGADFGDFDDDIPF